MAARQFDTSLPITTQQNSDSLRASIGILCHENQPCKTITECIPSNQRENRQIERRRKIF